MDDASFTQLLHDHAGLLTRIAASYEAEPALRDDLLQGIALALWKAIPGWRGEASLKTFIARVAHNRGATHVVNAMRRPRTHALDENQPTTDHDPQAQALVEQRRKRLQNAIRALPLSLRQPVTLALEGFKQRDIGEALGISTTNVAVRLHRARKALKDALGEMA